MRVDWTQDRKYLEFVENSLGVKFEQENITWLASVDDNNEILGVVVYSRHSKFNCEMSVTAASPLFLSRNVLKAFFGYPFNQLGYERVTAVVEATNVHAYQFNRKLGFTVEGVLRRWYGNCDGVVMGMLKEDCKWIRGTKISVNTNHDILPLPRQEESI